jgi:hypothetical protein
MIHIDLHLTSDDLLDIFVTYIGQCYGVKIDKEKLEVEFPKIFNLDFTHFHPNHPSEYGAPIQKLTITVRDHALQ